MATVGVSLVTEIFVTTVIISIIATVSKPLSLKNALLDRKLTQPGIFGYTFTDRKLTQPWIFGYTFTDRKPTQPGIFGYTFTDRKLTQPGIFGYTFTLTTQSSSIHHGLMSHGD